MGLVLRPRLWPCPAAVSACELWRWNRCVSRLAQGRQQQQNVEDAIKEMQKPLARYIDDQDLDRMLREQEREGDPMADLIKKRKAKENKEKKGLYAELRRGVL